jgi:DnaJ-class molecular chaperone
MKDFYAILEIAPTATPEVIKAAYRALAKRYHPDNGTQANESKFKEINAAHGVLINEETRANYDQQRRAAEQQPNHTAGQMPHDFPGQSLEDMMRNAASSGFQTIGNRLFDQFLNSIKGGGFPR